MTCSYLVCLKNNDETRPDRDDEWVQSKPHRGDIFVVKEHDQRWGKRESKQEWVAAGEDPELFPGVYGVVTVSDDGPHLEDVKDVFEVPFTRERTEDDPLYVDGSDNFVTVYQRAWRLRLSELTGPQQAALQRDGVVSVTEAEFESLCEHKGDRTFFDPGAPDGKGAVRPDADQPLPREEEP